MASSSRLALHYILVCTAEHGDSVALALRTRPDTPTGMKLRPAVESVPSNQEYEVAEIRNSAALLGENVLQTLDIGIPTANRPIND